jgi:exodeoxyribonuclease VII small subunit
MSDIQELNFEDAYAELNTIIEQLQSGDLRLEESVTLFERGQQLSAHCQALLTNAELRIQQINENGLPSNLG